MGARGEQCLGGPARSHTIAALELLFDFDSHQSQSGPKSVINVESFLRQRLEGWFVIVEIDLTHQPLEDSLGREAVAQTRIVGREFRLAIRPGLCSLAGTQNVGRSVTAELKPDVAILQI
jgi:hypothetical protein